MKNTLITAAVTLVAYIVVCPLLDSITHTLLTMLASARSKMETNMQAYDVRVNHELEEECGVMGDESPNKLPCIGFAAPVTTEEEEEMVENDK